MDTIKVTLGEREYELEPLPHKANKVWRKLAEEKLGVLLNGANALAGMELNSGADVVRAIERLARSIIFDSPDAVFELLMEYSPELRAAQGTIENEATDRQLFDALMEVVQQAYPLAGRLAGNLPGLQGVLTSTSSPEPNGDLTKQSSTA